MIRHLFFAAAGAAAWTAPLAAQSHADHAQHPAQSACTAEHAAMGHCTIVEEGAAPEQGPTPGRCTAEHAAMGHCMPVEPQSPVGQAGTGLAPGQAPAPRPVPANAADAVWGREQMAPTRDALRREHGGGRYNRVVFDLAEIRVADGPAGYLVEADAWYGGDINRFVGKVEAEGTFGERIHGVELKALYSRAIGPYFDLHAGLRQGFNAGPNRTHAALGMAGLAPYWFEVDAYLYLSTKGEVRASASAEYDQRITQRLILQPKVELALAAQDIPALGIGAGLSSVEIGLRLRYEIAREFAPYVGVVHEAKLGDTADFARAANADASSNRLVLGVRAWF